MLLRLLCAGLVCLACHAAPRDTRNIILITADGPRWQDLFGGMIGEHPPGSIVINAGYRDYDGPDAPARMHELSALQFEVLTPWTEERHDYITFEMALEYLRVAKPRVLHIALDETDDWAHDKRYNRVLDAISISTAACRSFGRPSTICPNTGARQRW